MKLHRLARSAPRAAALLLLATSVGCAYGYRDRDRERAPHRDTGVGASIILPGQSPPPVIVDPGAQQRWEHRPGSTRGSVQQGPGPAPSGPYGDPGTGAPGDPGGGGAAAGAGAPVARPTITSIGGSDEEEERHDKIREAPLWNKYLLAPFAALVYPFAKARDLVQGEPEPGPPVPQKNDARTFGPRQQQRANEQSRLHTLEERVEQRMERELASREPAGPQGSVPYTYAPAPGATDRSTALSIAEELQALRARRAQAAGPPTPSATAARPSVSSAHATRWDQVIDRDRDGIGDQWVQRQAGARLRQALDDDGDGVPERTEHYDPASGVLVRVDEDTDRDGRIDSWSDYESGALARRRSDTDGDGRVDAWSFYREDVLVRHESDSDGDGYRDRVRFYRDGRLLREARDSDADGYPEATLHYDEREQVVRRDEDLDADGVVDVSSHYEDGRLTRRELLTDLARAPRDDAAGGPR